MSDGDRMYFTFGRGGIGRTSASQRFVIRSAGQQLRQLCEVHGYRGLPRRIASGFLFVFFLGEPLDYRLSV
jgi:hypothetical protein